MTCDKRPWTTNRTRNPVLIIIAVVSYFSLCAFCLSFSLSLSLSVSFFLSLPVYFFVYFDKVTQNLLQPPPPAHFSRYLYIANIAKTIERRASISLSVPTKTNALFNPIISSLAARMFLVLILTPAYALLSRQVVSTYDVLCIPRPPISLFQPNLTSVIVRSLYLGCGVMRNH